MRFNLEMQKQSQCQCIIIYILKCYILNENWETPFVDKNTLFYYYNLKYAIQTKNQP